MKVIFIKNEKVIFIKSGKKNNLKDFTTLKKSSNISVLV